MQVFIDPQCMAPQVNNTTGGKSLHIPNSSPVVGRLPYLYETEHVTQGLIHLWWDGEAHLGALFFLQGRTAETSFKEANHLSFKTDKKGAVFVWFRGQCGAISVGSIYNNAGVF